MIDIATLKSRLLDLAIYLSVLALISSISLIFYEVLHQSLEALRELGFRLMVEEWNPSLGKYGLAPSLVASFTITSLALLLSVPTSLLVSLYLVFYSSSRVRATVRIAVELLAGIPSVIYGAWGLFVLVPWINDYFGPLVGSSLGKLSPLFRHCESYTGNVFSASTVLAIMVFPILVFTQLEFLSSVPRDYIEAALSVGATKWQVIKTVALPTATPGILAGIILGFGRAIGETMAVSMVSGPTNPPTYPYSLFSPATTITTLILMNIGSLTPGFFEWSALFAAALILLILSILSILLVRILSKTISSKGKVRAFKLLYKPSGKLAELEEKAFLALMTLTSLTIIGVLACILGAIITRGAIATMNIGPKLFYECIRFEVLSAGRAGFGGGLINDIVGSLTLSALATSIATPVAVLSAIYKVEYARRNLLLRAVRIVEDSLSTIPSVIFGIFGFSLFVITLRAITGGVSLLSGGLVLAILILPYISRSIEEALRTVPSGVKEAVLSLGGGKIHLVEVELRQIAPTLVSSILNGFLRTLTESAPLIFTAGPSNFIPRRVWDPAGNLAVRIFLLSFEYRIYDHSIDYAYAASFILIVLVISLSAFSRALYRYFRRYTIP